jgi:hypothetical protein
VREPLLTTVKTQQEVVMEIKDMKDATKPLPFKVRLLDCEHVIRRSPDRCVQAKALLRNKNIEKVKVCKTMTYIKFVGDAVPTRFQNPPLVRELVRINDQEGKRGLVKKLVNSNGELELVIDPPRPQIRLKNLRSDAMRKARKRSHAKHVNNPNKRKYHRAGDLGIRSGVGKAFIWESDEQV